MTEMRSLSAAVRKVATGYVLMYLNLKIDGFDLLGDWLGWILIWLAIQDLKTVRPKLALLQGFAVVLGLMDVVQWLPFWEMPDWLRPVSVTLTIIRIYFDFHMLTELACLAGEIPGGGGEGLSRQILSARTAIVVLQTAMVLSGMVPVPFFHIGLLETLWSGGLFFLVLFQLAFVAFLMYQLFELAKILEQADPFTPENE